MATDFQFNPYAPEFNTDPFPSLKTLRDEYPIYFWEGGQGWCLSDYDDCISVMRDNQRFSANFQDWELAPPAPDSVFQKVQAKSLFGLAPADQTRVRKIIAPIFSTNAMNKRRPQIRAIIDGILDEAGPVEVIDLMPQVAERVPIRVITGILDIPVRPGLRGDRDHHALCLQAPPGSRAASQGQRCLQLRVRAPQAGLQTGDHLRGGQRVSGQRSNGSAGGFHLPLEPALSRGPFFPQG